MQQPVTMRQLATKVSLAFDKEKTSLITCLGSAPSGGTSPLSTIVAQRTVKDICSGLLSVLPKNGKDQVLWELLGNSTNQANCSSDDDLAIPMTAFLQERQTHHDSINTEISAKKAHKRTVNEKGNQMLLLAKEMA